MARRRGKRGAQKQTHDWCKEVKNPIVQWFCKSSFAKIFIYDSKRTLIEGLRRSLSEGSGLLFYFTLVVGHVLALMILIKQYFDTVNFSLPYDAVEIYFAFLAAFVFANELDKWRMGKKEPRLFRKGENALVMWLFVLLVSWSLQFFMNKPVPEELGVVIKGALIGFVISKVSTVLKYRKCSRGKK